MQVKFTHLWSYAPDVRTTHTYEAGRVVDLAGDELRKALEAKACEPWQSPDEIQVPPEDLTGDDEPAQPGAPAAPEVETRALAGPKENKEQPPFAPAPTRRQRR